jgi:glycosyltransferase involved in cell wall biosynthesis
LIKGICGFASVRLVERDRNLGLANSIISGVTEVLDVYDRVIVLEDDLLTSRHFLIYMNSALEKYRDDSHVFSVTGHTFPHMPVPADYPYDTYPGYRCSSWSWGTWPNRWRLIDWEMKYFDQFKQDTAAQEKFDRGGCDMTTLLKLQHAGKIDSWAIRFCYAHHANDMCCIYPIKTLVRNIGLDNSGTHRPEPRFFHQSLDETWLPRVFCPADSMDRRITATFHALFERRQAISLRVLLVEALSKARIILSRINALARRIKRGIIPFDQDVDILMVNAFQKNGGAARAAYRTFCCIRNRYPRSHYLTLIKEDFGPSILGHMHTSLVRVLARLDRIPRVLYPRRTPSIFSPAFWPNPLRVPLKRFRPKIIHLHWVGAGLLGVEELGRLRSPIVWTLHDAWAFTGGCHYTSVCEGFKEQCGYCPQLGSHGEHDYSHYLMRRKARAFEKLDITVVAPSRWMADMAKQSSLFARRRIEVIPNGLDTERFKPINHQVARDYLNLPQDMPVLLFGAQYLTDPRKGSDLLCEALRLLDTPFTLLLFGEGNVVPQNASKTAIRRLGTLADDMSLAMAYSAADVFVCPSREDNLPNTVAEALSCGTPCAAFDINGLPDMIEHRKNGWLARPFDPVDLAEGIRWLTQHPQQDQLRQAAREKAVSEYSLSVMEERYEALYTDLLKSLKS